MGWYSFSTIGCNSLWIIGITSLSTIGWNSFCSIGLIIVLIIGWYSFWTICWTLSGSKVVVWLYISKFWVSYWVLTTAIFWLSGFVE